MKRKLLIGFVAVVTLFFVMCLPRLIENDVAAAEATSGTTGECTWVLDNGILTISGNGAMGNYDDSSPWGTDVTEVIIEEGVTSIGSSAFSYCRKLTKITIPEGVTSIGSSAFFACHELTEIIIPKGVTSIGDDAFYACGFKEITIPEGVTSIGSFAFCSCDELTEIIIPKGVTSIEAKAFSGCSSLKEITIPKGVTSIEDEAFSGCSSLKEITIQEGITRIGSGAFARCSLDTVYYAGPEAEWEALVTNVNIDYDNIVFICYLAKIEITTLPTTIQYYRWEDELSLIGGVLTLYYSDDTTETVSLDQATVTGFNNTQLGTQKLTVSYLGKTTTYEVKIVERGTTGECTWVLDNGVLTISGNGPMGDYADYPRAPWGTHVKELIIEEGVTSIGNHAFSNCSGLTSIEFPEGLTSIGYSAFSNCSGLTGIEFPEGLTSIRNNAFSNCSGLTSIELLKGVTSIGIAAFSNCSELTSIEFPEGLTNIGDMAFYKCENLASIEIPESVLEIGKSAFKGCSRLKSITLSFVGESASSNTYLGYIFGASSYEENESYVPVSLKEVIIRENCTSIRDFAFYGCDGLTSIKLPKKLTSVGESAFCGCDMLTSIELPEGLTSIGESAFCGCDMLTSIELPEGLTSIGESAFYQCGNLTSIELPKGVTSVGKSTFERCRSLECITVPFIGGSADKNTYLGYIFGADSYSDNSKYVPESLKHVVISEGCTSIASCALYNCTGLETVTISKSVIDIGTNAFSRCDFDTVYYGGTIAEWTTLKGSSKITYDNLVYYNLIKIELTKLPTKLEYVEYTDSVSTLGGELTLFYNGDITETYSLSNATVTGFDNTKLGIQELTVSYLGYTFTYEVEIIEKEDNTTEFAGGKGFAYDPYLVATKEHLNNVKNYLGAHFKQVNDIVFTPSDFAKGGTYYNSGYGWVPIGKDSSTAFKGSYDGGGYIIANIQTNITTANSAYGGLFGYNKGTLKNITVKNSSIAVTAEGSSYAGGIAGYTSGTIENCHNKNTSVNAQYAGGIAGDAYYPKIISNCTNSGSLDGIYVGGIVGRVVTSTVSGPASFSDSSAQIINCTNTGSIIKRVTSGAYVGGIVGYHRSGTLIIRYCNNSGNLYAEGTDLSSISYGGCPCVGGIVGFSNDTDIRYCDNAADIYGDYAGGIVGYGNTVTFKCENSGDITGRTYVGGIVGCHVQGTISGCENQGDIIGRRYSNGNVVSDSATAVGGIVGNVTSASTAVYNSSNIGNVYNGNYSGGIAGVADVISGCYNTGMVSSAKYASGICGNFYHSSSEVSDCYNIGRITGAYAAGILANMTKGLVSTCYNTGSITSNSIDGYYGGIVAYQTAGSITTCYYLNNVDLGVGYIDYSISTTPNTRQLNESAMKNQASFEGFDFDSTWTMDGNEDYSYPELLDVTMVYGSVPGDVNGDKKINSLDGLLLMRYLNGWNVNIASPEAMDVNGDGKVNSLDGLILMRYLNGWNVTLG